MDLNSVLFYILAAQIGICSLAVVITQNIVRAAAWLLFALAGTAGIFFLLGADFVGATQLLVYVGGTLVLVAFGVMLTAQGPFVKMRISAAEWAIAGVVGLVLYGVLTVCLLRSKTSEATAELPPSITIGEALLGSSAATPRGNVSNLTSQTPRMRTPVNYLLPFEIVSVHLLVVLIGAAYLARARRRRGATP